MTLPGTCTKKPAQTIADAIRVQTEINKSFAAKVTGVVVKINFKAIITVLIAVVILAPFLSHADDKSSIDVVLVMDSSGSMKKTDPLSLRIPAAKLFISLLDNKDRASVVSFSDKSYPIIHLTPVDSEKNKDQLLKAADKITSTGLFTNLYDALSAGLDILSEDKKGERSKIIVLMSDGMMDVGDTDKDRDLVDKIRNEMAATLEDKGIKVYAIAFTEQSDRQLLEKISKHTGGFYNLALTDKDFHLIFTSIFESLKSPDMLPVSENGFLIDGSIEEVTIVATKDSPKTQIHLNAPDGQRYSNRNKSTGIGWFASDNFDMITIKNPVEGRWEILFSAGDNNKAYIITNLKLHTNFDQLYSTFGDPLDIQMWLEKDGSTLTEPYLLDKIDIYIELTGPDGKTSKLTPFSKGGGILVRRVAPFTPGNYKLRIVAQGNTFEREKTFVFNVADAKESKEDILAQREKKMKAEKPVQRKPENSDKEDRISWKKVIIQFISINLALFVIVFIYIKRKSFKNISGLKNLINFSKIRGSISREKESDEDADDYEYENEVSHTDQEDGQTQEQVIPEKTTETADQKVVYEESKQEIPLDNDEDQGGQEVPIEHYEQKAQKQEVTAENQDKASEIQEITQERDDQESKQEVDAENPDRKEAVAQDNPDENIDDIWQEALKEQEETQKLVKGSKVEEAVKLPEKARDINDNREIDIASFDQEIKADNNSQILNQEDLDNLLATADEVQEKKGE